MCYVGYRGNCVMWRIGVGGTESMLGLSYHLFTPGKWYLCYLFNYNLLTVISYITT